jgi:hypothetical protein
MDVAAIRTGECIKDQVLQAAAGGGRPDSRDGGKPSTRQRAARAAELSKKVYEQLRARKS